MKRRRIATTVENQNYLFYSNEIEAKPSMKKIEELLAHWADDYDKLEYDHGYIQWLFPLLEGPGMNSRSSALTREELKYMKNDLQICRRFITSYKMMLKFYGLELTCERTGKVQRLKDGKLQRQRYKNLNNNYHNNLRITRILTSLSHMGFADWKFELLQFLEHEIQVNKQLPNCHYSLTKFWLPLRDVNSESYKNTTLELPEDREENVYLKALKAGIGEEEEESEEEEDDSDYQESSQEGESQEF